MKRTLQVFGEPSDRTPADPVALAVGSTRVSVADAHDGAAARQFGQLMVDAGGRWLDHDPTAEVDFRIVVRSTPESPEARLRSDVWEEAADLVVGSVRAGVARRLTKKLS